MDTLPNLLSNASSPAVSLEAPIYTNGNCAAHHETIRISKDALDNFMYWHAGWDALEVSSNFASTASTTLLNSSHLPLLLHNLSWEACNQELVVDTLRPVSSKQMAVVTFRIPGATTIRTDFISSLPKRRLHIECHDGREFTIVIQLSLRRRKEYVETLHRLSISDGPSTFCPAA